MAYRLWPAQLAAGSVVLLLGFASRLPSDSPEELAALAAPFSFTRLPLPDTGNPNRVDVHPVNPRVSHIARWLSSVGTAASLGDLDEDGVNNDLCAVEPRTSEVRVSPVPGTGDRFPLFVLGPTPALDPHTYIPTGCKFGDFNEDGWTDLLVHYVGRTPLIFLRQAPSSAVAPLSNASFKAQALLEDQPWWTSTVLQADVDGDGHLDLVVANYFPDGQRIFGENATGPVTMHESFARARNGGKNRIFLWSSATPAPSASATYREVPNPFADDDATAWTLALGAADLDGDSLVELYFANDFGPDTLYANRSTPGKVSLIRLHGKRTALTPTSRVLGNDSFKGMGVDFGDVNGDGLFDLFVSNITEHGGLEESHFLFLSTGDLQAMDSGRAPYVDDGEAMGVSRSSWAWDTRLVDFDNNGTLELMQATGFLKGQTNWWADLAELANANDKLVSNPANWPSFPQNIDISGHAREPFYVLGSEGRYQDVSRLLGFDGAYNARGLATGDVDADGDVDLVLANQWEDSFFFRNDARKPGRSLGLHLRLSKDARNTQVVKGLAPATSSWPAIGAVAQVTLPDGRKLIRQIDGGSGHSGAPAPEAVFGLGNLPPDAPLTVVIRYRNLKGQAQTVTETLTPGWHTITLASL